MEKQHFPEPAGQVECNRREALNVITAVAGLACTTLLGCTPTEQKKRFEIAPESVERICSILRKYGTIEEFGNDRPSRIVICAGQLHPSETSSIPMITNKKFFNLYIKHQYEIAKAGEELAAFLNTKDHHAFELFIEGATANDSGTLGMRKRVQFMQTLSYAEEFAKIHSADELDAYIDQLHTRAMQFKTPAGACRNLNLLHGTLRLAAILDERNQAEGSVMGIEKTDEDTQERREAFVLPFEKADPNLSPEKALEKLYLERSRNVEAVFRKTHTEMAKIVDQHTDIGDTAMVVMGQGHIKVEELEVDILGDAALQYYLLQYPDLKVITWESTSLPALLDISEQAEEEREDWRRFKTEERYLQQVIEAQQQNRSRKELFEFLEKGEGANN